MKKMPKFELVLFDFDGTLVPAGHWNEAKALLDAKKELKKMGFNIEAFSSVSNYAILWNKAYLEALSGKAKFSASEVKKRIGKVYEAYDLDALSRWKLLPGVIETLNSLKVANVHLALVTTVGRKAIELALSKFALNTFFEIIITRDEVNMIKPNGEAIKLALRYFNVMPSKAVIVGDSVADVLAARDAGIKVISVLGGWSSKEQLLKVSPDFIVNSINEVVDVVLA